MALPRTGPASSRTCLIHIALLSEFPTDAAAEPLGGVEASVARLADALFATGVEVTVVAPARPGKDVFLRREGMPTVVGAARDPRLSLATRLRSWRRAVGRVLEAVRPDLVHGHGLVVGGLGAVGQTRLPSVVTAHGDARADTLEASRSARSLARAALQRRLAESVVRRATAIVGVHADWRVNLPFRPRSFRFIPNIVSEPFFATAREPLPGRVVFCGGPRRIKGADLLLAAWPEVRRAVPGASLAFLGWPAAPPDGGEEILVRAQVAPAELARELARAEVLVVPSRFEVAPLVVGEAWAVGTPVVSTDRGGLPGLVSGAGVVASAEPSSLARAMIGLLREPGSAEELVREGGRRVQEQRADRVAAAHRSLYDALLASA